MIYAILGIFITAATGSLSVPILMLALARFGYFEPIRFFAFGRSWDFSPRTEVSFAGTDAAILVFPRQVVFASAVTAVCTITAPSGPNEGWRAQTQAAASGIIRDVPRFG